MFRNVSAWHIIVLVVVVLLLFGANRLPGLAKSVGQSLKIFKSEVKDLRDDSDAPPAKNGATTAERRPDDPTEGTTPPKV
ncbi:Sec-independent protein translocase subunit TatA [Cellulomonas fimi]|uniref:Sec-independent protein translocase protein TatA n=1 Tax=Cellulomonas fimi (strain ATCC 484 / DSM 20113 / JCM 1341 / CCUG 24087 / LMG 16345 / NBRC 15513 / NCIMB 8980 / NCTC 7547 / NRS-133) TaxID=590998 RepID=F4GZN9_CELFA|nr:Sec-independent protein translocase subunit TatA [Cellulomonas fimi]AEE46083.1 twin-arginine translocation protein, TatA/E family subunit [Cellulomonas fimi ATCC 484]NNH06934.1 Sec-independent protein translocase subunit TatA [Cellulomonas fimi]VEH31561.1 twin arginine translocase protein A [Cellulomonas fimi]